ncbi:hypothetical protein [Streptomyces sp. NPDC060333]|uniref:hypothetical protein n=1 Tax=Streptomyces sp. NPDC060333 TaxID=3347098 RepID=UPI00364D98B0
MEQKTLEYPEPLRLIDERSTAFRAAITSAPDLDMRVRTDLPRVEAVRSGAYPGEGRALLGRHHRRRTCRRDQVLN